MSSDIKEQRNRKSTKQTLKLKDNDNIKNGKQAKMEKSKTKSLKTKLDVEEMLENFEGILLLIIC